MNNYRALEPAPTRFFAPVGLFSEPDLNQMGAEWLGEWVKRPGYEFADGELEAMGLGHLLPFIEASPPQRVASGPLCRLYWVNGKPTPHSFESAYEQDERGRWRRYHANYLSYLLRDGGYITVRWESPKREAIAPKTALHQQSVTKQSWCSETRTC
jgi:hypothetical protein